MEIKYKDGYGKIKKTRVYGLLLDNLSNYFTFRTGGMYMPEGDDEYEVCEYDPKEIWDSINWYDIEWKHHLKKEEFLKKYKDLILS